MNNRGYRSTDYYFDRRQSSELKRIPWASDRDTFPQVIQWGHVGDGLVAVALCIAAVVGLLLMTGAIA